MNYRAMAAAIRKEMLPIRQQAGRWLLRDVKAAWDRGDKGYIIPPGTYAINEPFPVARGGRVDGNGKVTLLCHAMNYFVEYDPSLVV